MNLVTLKTTPGKDKPTEGGMCNVKNSKVFTHKLTKLRADGTSVFLLAARATAQGHNANGRGVNGIKIFHSLHSVISSQSALSMAEICPASRGNPGSKEPARALPPANKWRCGYSLEQPYF